LFIEKPLSHTPEGLSELQQLVADRRLVSIVGCNMRFHPGPRRVKQLLVEGAIDQVLFARVYTGSYLPEWRPQQDYRHSYSAQAALGGGCLLDCIHEIDLARWYLGEVAEVFCLAGHVSRLEFEVEDVALLTCRHQSGVVSEIHLDYLQRTYERGCQIVGEDGSIFWDYQTGEVRWFNATDKTWQTFKQPGTWSVNQMYLDEMQHFLGCLEAGQVTTLPVSEAIKVMNIVFAAKASAASGCLTRVQSL
jgi:predicted dehydrogenase